MSNVLTERFCQESLKNYFGPQRAIDARKDNPSIWVFGLISSEIRIFRQIAGNVCGQYIGIADFFNEALPCCKKPKKD